jgi:hypothetical protein
VIANTIHIIAALQNTVFWFVFKHFLQYAGVTLSMYIFSYDYVYFIRCETVHCVMFIVQSVTGCNVVLVVKCLAGDEPENASVQGTNKYDILNAL